MCFDLYSYPLPLNTFFKNILKGVGKGKKTLPRPLDFISSKDNKKITFTKPFKQIENMKEL